jgi:hypothetical protein
MMPFEQQHPIVLHSCGCPCSAVIERDFIPKGIEQFGRSSQEKDLGYKSYLVLLIWEQLVLVVLVEKIKWE